MNFTLNCNAKSDFTPWDVSTTDFPHCFLHLCLELPIFAILSVTSAYYVGKRRLSYTSYTAWNSYQSGIIYCRAFIVGLLAIIPVSSAMIRLSFHDSISLVEDFLIFAKTLAWLLHLMFILMLKRGVSFNTRGPKSVIVSWLLTAIVSSLVFRSRYINIDVTSATGDDAFLLRIYLWSAVVEALFQGFYLLTLIPGDILLDERHYRALHNDMRDTYESQAYLNHEANSYVGFHDDDQDLALGTAKENSGIISNLFFWWVTPILKKGSCGFLHTTDDLFDLPAYLSTQHIAKYFQQWASHPHNSLLKSLHICFGWEFYSIGILKVIQDVLGFCGPILLNLLVTYVETEDTDDATSGYVYVTALFFASLLGALCGAHFNMYMVEVNMKIRASLITEIYRKTTQLRQVDFKKFTSGEIINFLSQDTARIVNACPSFHALWSLPIQVAGSLYLLYRQIGSAFLAGVAFAIILIPINRLIANKIGILSTKMMKFKDQRVNLMSEVLYGIRVVKYHSWENFFIERINGIREKELACLKGRKYLDAMCVYFWATTPVLISVLSFTAYILMGNQLTASKVFTSLALFNMLIGPLNALPWVINGVVEAWVSLKRVDSLLSMEQIEPHMIYDNIIPTEEQSLDDHHLVVDNATFEWSNDGFQLNKLNFALQKGKMIGLVGEVGSGKSSFLLALLGELEKVCGKIALNDYNDGFGVVLQESWIQRGTIRDNILFGEPFNQKKYNAVIEGCCLKEDLQELDRGDDTVVGENGQTLSGGQKIRVSLARAVYQNKNFYLLDDIFSAVDYKVAKELNRKCVHGLLKEKTRIGHRPTRIITQIKFLRGADWILIIDKGTIINQGTPEDMLPIFFGEEEDFSTESPSSDKLISFENVTASLPDNDEEENQEKGSIKSSVYYKYVTAVGPILSLVVILFLLAMQVSRNATDLWLAHWVASTTSNSNSTPTPDPGPTTTTTTTLPFIVQSIVGEGGHSFQLYNWGQSLLNPDVKYYFVVFVVIGIVNSFMTLGRSFFFAYGSIQGGKRIHQQLIHSVIEAKIVFFDLTPLGRILNRFSSDQGTVDDSLPFILNILLAQFCGLLGTLFVTCLAMPWILVIIIPMLLVSNNIQKYYRHTSRQLRRLASVSLSPIYAQFSETLKGIVTIRAMRATRRFQEENESHLEENQKAEFSTQAVSQWLNIRLQIIGVFIVTGVGLIGVLQHSFQIANSAMLGLAISYALTVTNSLSSFVTFFTETEKEMVAVERVSEYIDTIEAESNTESLLTTPYGWPAHGCVAFCNVSLQYRPDLPYALKNVTFETRPHEKIGVVGRTGSGKSSIFQALFRMVDGFEGIINIDTVNTKNLNLKYLRSKLCIIPQDPLIFSGSIRENLDPLGLHRDEILFRALEKCQLLPCIEQLGGLDAFVGESGNLLSVGQKQLLSLTKALLVNAKILCIDEATANVDHETDKIIQATIRSSFWHTTIITIAHRVNTVLHYDRVLVMKSGEIMEFDEPQALLAKKNSYLYQIVHGKL